MTKSLLHTNWPNLLNTALKALDTLPDGTRWTWGGGTALSIHLDHRISFDIDIFLLDADALRLLSPSRNPTVRSITEIWQEPGHYLKLERPEGEIDFIVSGLMTDPGFGMWPFEGRELPLETVTEVLAKKLHWRGSRTQARDVFDLAAAYHLAPDSFAAAVKAQPEGARRMADYITRRHSRITREMPLAVNLTDAGRGLPEVDLLLLASELASGDPSVKG